MAHFFTSSLLLFVFLIYFFPLVYSSPNEYLPMAANAVVLL